MAPDHAHPSDGTADTADSRLDSWKDIASYLKRDVSTVQRWEKREAMPVHRHLHGKLGSVYAFRSELDDWWKRRAVTASPAELPLETDDRVAGVIAAIPTAAASSRRRAISIAVSVAAAAALLAVATWTIRPSNLFWRNPLADARFQSLTDFDGSEFAAAISRDGKYAAFLSDRDGPIDVWVTQIGSGQFHNLTRGAVQELVNPSVRTMTFSSDGSSVAFWVRRPGATRPDDIGIWSAPLWTQAPPQPYLDGIAEIDWSGRGTELVYHTAGPGDPTFIRNLAGGADRRIFVASAGLHAHFPIWSPDEAFVYFVQGSVPDAMDIWRVPTAGGTAERLTFHNAYVSHPVFLDSSTLAYVAAESDGSGPWLFGLDVRSHATHRLSVGSEKYRSLAASADRRRLVATIARPKGTLWRVGIGEHPVKTVDAKQIVVPAGRAASPRSTSGGILFVSTRDDGDAIAKLSDGRTTELWTAAGGHVVGAPAVSPDRQRIAFTAEQQARVQLFVMNADGSGVHALAAVGSPVGAPAWSPDGRSLAIADNVEGTPRLVRVGVEDDVVAPLSSEYSIEPAWSPDGSLLVYSGADVGTTFAVRSLMSDGSPSGVVAMTLTRGGRRMQFLPGQRSLVFLKGEIEHKNFWLRDLDTGAERQLTDFGAGIHVHDFEVSPDAREILFDQEQETSDVVLIDIPRR